MGLHPITAGHGYTYLTRQVAVGDGPAVTGGGIGVYYAEAGESPGRWLGNGLESLGVAAGSAVSEAQMVALFGEGRHPDAAAIAAAVTAELASDGTYGAEGADGVDVEQVAAQVEVATRLGRPFVLNAANSQFRRQVAQLLVEWNTERGLPAGAPVPPEVRAWVRTAVGKSLFAAEHGREAADAQELSGFVNRASRVGSKAVAGFDLTFSPVKSVSALWALADPAIAREIAAAHDAAVAHTMAWLERTAAFTRLGRDGVRQVEVRGLVAAAFTHRTSRAGDPDLHTHVAVSNKVQTLDGRWRALDGRVLFKATVAASERYNTRLEAELRARLGVRFVARARPGRRPVRELAGVDERLLAAWSRRRGQIDEARAALTVDFEAEHGRPPTPGEAIELAQRATLDTRPDKHQPQAEAAQRARWHAEAAAALGQRAVAGMIADVTGRAAGSVAPASRAAATAASGEWVEQVAGEVIDRVAADRATWQRWHIEAETQRALRHQDVPLGELDAAAAAVAAAALDRHSVALPRPDRLPGPAADPPTDPEAPLPTTPARTDAPPPGQPPATPPGELCRSDGASVYEVAGSQFYTSNPVLAAEHTVLTAAGRTDGRRADPQHVEVALLEATANGLPLNDGQAAFVRELATSGARCQLALAAAGTGKTTALQVLTRAWVEDGGHVVAVAPSAAAARLLGQATGIPADTLAKLLDHLAHHDGDPDADTDTSVASAASRVGLSDRTLVLVDEAGMAGTADLARLAHYAMAAGASVRLVGDDRQLAAVGAGGLLRDLAESTPTATLQVAVRFADQAEAAAALGIRAGEHDAIEHYLDRRRVHVGDEHTAPRSALEAWAADLAAGCDALLLASTREQVTALNARARAERRTAQPTGGWPRRREVRLVDGTAASAGDPVITRRNARGLRISATDWVKNGDRWMVGKVHRDGAMTVVHRDTSRRVRLPADYVAEFVALGYASTIHGAQGSTADVCHTVITGAETREQLYVALSRGREANNLHVVLPGAADEHAPIRRDTLLPPAAVDLLHRVLDREAAQRSATTERRALDNPTRRLREAVARYTDSLTVAPTTSSDHKAPVAAAPLPWLPPVPGCADAAWTSYLTARARQISELADQVLRDVVNRSPGLRGEVDMCLRGDLALWSITHPADHDGRELTARERLYLRHLAQRRNDPTGQQQPDPRRRWLALVGAVHPPAVNDPAWPALAKALTDARRVGLDVDRLLPRVQFGRSVSVAAAALREMAAAQDVSGQPGQFGSTGHQADRDAMDRHRRSAIREPDWNITRPRGIGL